MPQCLIQTLQIYQGTDYWAFCGGKVMWLFLNTLKKFSRSFSPSVLSRLPFPSFFFILLLVLPHFSLCAFSFICMNSKIHSHTCSLTRFARVACFNFSFFSEYFLHFKIQFMSWTRRVHSWKSDSLLFVILYYLVFINRVVICGHNTLRRLFNYLMFQMATI